MTKKTHDFLPFENVADLETFCKKFDCSHFLLGSHTKKRPNNLILGRLFNFQVLDMIEFGITDYKSIAKSQNSIMGNNIGSKPCLLFQGDLFENNERMKMVQNLFLDCFRGEHNVKTINLLGLDHVMVFTALSENTVHLGHYAIQFEKSGQATPKVILHDIGPSMTLEIRRHQFAGNDLRKEALKIPKVLTLKNKDMKNVFINELGDREARIFVEQQEIGTIALKKSKALSKTEEAKVEEQQRAEELGKKLLEKKRAFVESAAEVPTKKRKKE
jgi:ribosome production factor 2